jgi:peptidoglycan/LPS O-acetylase OafA/YrhL
MNNGMSKYLELIRVIATFLVLISHAKEFAPAWLQSNFSELKLGRDGVILFFVLSGYVITWCGIEKEKTLYNFATNRIARIYSVAIPGLVLGIIASLVYSYVKHEPVHYTIEKVWLYYPVFITFNSQSWLGFISPAGNFPYWSLSYEVWYYIFISIIFFCNKYRLLVALLAILIMGPYIALFLPLWGLGVLLYIYKDKCSTTPAVHWFIFLFTLFVFVYSKYLGIDTKLDQYNSNLLGHLNYYLPAKQFLGDYYLALIAVINFHSAYHLNFEFNQWVTRVVKYFASFSFSIYMYHIPILIIFSCIPFYEQNSLVTYFSAILLSLTLARLLAIHTEMKKRSLINLIDNCYAKLKGTYFYLLKNLKKKYL